MNELTKFHADFDSIKEQFDTRNPMESAIFLHCTNDKPTAGCIAIKKRYNERAIRNYR